MDAIPIEKDVEGLSKCYRDLLLDDVRDLEAHNPEPPVGVRSQRKCILPCTPLAVVKVLEYLMVSEATHPATLAQSGGPPPHPDRDRGARCMEHYMQGRTVVIFNRSEIVGRPLACMLNNDGARVYSVDLEGTFLLTKRHQFEKVLLTTEEVLQRANIVITGVPNDEWRLPTEWVQPGSTVINISEFQNVDEDAIVRIPGVRFVAQLLVQHAC
ncbi:hypothetical protein T484DRAFT_2548527 [Baffinella frigidus]|nr:hypothetical protein T484DRAFT_2548527 [Cryptophyta sp. CCMP2293]